VTGVTPAEFRAGAVVDEYDAVYVATPNATHLEYVAAAAEQGKAVLCEKPLEATLDRSRRLVAACRDAGVPLMAGYRMQTDPAVRRLRDLLEAGVAGDVIHVHATMSQTMLGELGSDHDQWRLDSELSGGCALMDLGVYPLNTIRFVLGADPRVRVSGRTRTNHEVRRCRRTRHHVPAGVPRWRRRAVFGEPERPAREPARSHRNGRQTDPSIRRSTSGRTEGSRSSATEPASTSTSTKFTRSKRNSRTSATSCWREPFHPNGTRAADGRADARRHLRIRRDRPTDRPHRRRRG